MDFYVTADEFGQCAAGSILGMVMVFVTGLDSSCWVVGPSI